MQIEAADYVDGAYYLVKSAILYVFELPPKYEKKHWAIYILKFNIVVVYLCFKIMYNINNNYI